MTLDTHVYVLDEVDVQELFKECQRLLGVIPSPDGGYMHMDGQSVKWRDEEPSYTNRRTGETKLVYDEGIRVIGNHIAQGLDALMDIQYRASRPLTTQEESERHDEWCEKDCDGAYHDPPCFCRVSLDTTYGYRDEKGWGCGDLHAHLLAELGCWLDEHGISWGWRNEFTGERWYGEDRYSRLADLGRHGAEASEWFRTKVKPAITTTFLRSGRFGQNVEIEEDLSIPDEYRTAWSEMFAVLDLMGVAKVTAEYSGADDEGWIDDVSLFAPDGRKLAEGSERFKKVEAWRGEDDERWRSVVEHVIEFLNGVLQERSPGWEDSEGGAGTVEVDVAGRTAHFDHGLYGEPPLVSHPFDIDLLDLAPHLEALPMCRWRRSVTYEVEARTLEQAEELWANDGPETSGMSIRLHDITEFEQAEEGDA